jgi:hypothetical protein
MLRKSACACGGGCPNCQAENLKIQPKLRISQPNDPYEKEADRVAEQVMRMPAPALQRTCASCIAGGSTCPECDAEKEGLVQPKAERDSDPLGSVPDSSLQDFGSGQPLDSATRGFFEPRFGHDLSDVRVHTGAHAKESARSLSALAYTVGTDVVFDSGRYSPQTGAGQRLLAHELTHVLQQKRESERVVRRISYGTRTPPVWTGRTLTAVPVDERAKVNEAIAMVDEVVSHPDNFPECHSHYAERCPGGGPGTLAAVWGSAVLWRITAGGEGANARGDVGGTNIAYTQNGYGQTVPGLARTLMHEAGHNCGIPGGDPHWHAAQIATYCIGEGRNVLSFLAGGPYVGESGDVESGALLLSYRRLLGDWASGHLNLTLGADLNFMTMVAEIVELAEERPEDERLVGEFGSFMVGLHGRVSPWGGPRYGGLTGRIETGFGAGRFALRPADPSERERTSIEASWVLQIGVGAEFALPDIFTEGAVVPLSVQAAYRLVQPLNSEAERLHGVIGGLFEFLF